MHILIYLTEKSRLIFFHYYIFRSSDRNNVVKNGIREYTLIMIIKEPDYNTYKGQKYQAEIVSDRFLSIEPSDEGFEVKWVMSEELLRMTIYEDLLQDWLDQPVAYGAFEDDKLIGMAEGFLEKWNNRFVIANICVFDGANRRSGIGTKLMEAILQDAKKSGARMVILETQTFNYKAISFYKKHGFEIIGFDRYCYSNKGPEEHNMRVEMGKFMAC